MRYVPLFYRTFHIINSLTFICDYERFQIVNKREGVNDVELLIAEKFSRDFGGASMKP